MKSLTSIISWLFLPLFVPIYGLLVILYLPVPSISFLTSDSLYLIDPTAKFLFLSLFLVFIVFAPGVSFLVMKRNKIDNPIKMETADGRLTPIALMTFYLIVLFFFLFFQKEGALIPPIIKAMVLGGVIAGILAYFITTKLKISLHSLGMGALFGFIYMFSKGLEHPPVILLSTILILSGIVMSSRLLSKEHTIKEVGWGYILGFATQAITIGFYV